MDANAQVVALGNQHIGYIGATPSESAEHLVSMLHAAQMSPARDILAMR